MNIETVGSKIGYKPSNFKEKIGTIIQTNPADSDKWDSLIYGIGGPIVWSENYTIFTKAEKDFIKILDLGYILRTPYNEALYIKVEGSRDINVDLYKINITQDFGLKFNSLEINKRYSIAELKEMMNELS